MHYPFLGVDVHFQLPVWFEFSGNLHTFLWEPPMTGTSFSNYTLSSGGDGILQWDRVCDTTFRSIRFVTHRIMHAMSTSGCTCKLLNWSPFSSAFIYQIYTELKRMNNVLPMYSPGGFGLFRLRSGTHPYIDSPTVSLKKVRRVVMDRMWTFGSSNLPGSMIQCVTSLHL